MFMVTLTMATIGMVMIMLRSAMHPYKSVKRNPYLDQDDKISEYEEYKSYVGYMSEFVNMWKKKDGDYSSEPTATWSGSLDSRSEEEKSLSPTTPAISWENHVIRPASIQSGTGSNNGEDYHNSKTPRVRPSSLMFSPRNRGSERNFFDLRSPLSSNSYNMSVSSQSMSDAHSDEEQPLSPETPSIVWDNDWENKVNRCLAGSSPLSLGSNGGIMMLSPVPGVINDEEQPLSPENPSISSNSINLEKKNSAATPSSTVSSSSMPSLHSDNFNEIDVTTQPDSNDVADSLLSVGFLGAVLGSPAPSSLRKKKKKNANLWHGGELVDAVPSISWDENMLSPGTLSVSSLVNSPDATNDKANNVEGEDKLLLVSPKESFGKKNFDMRPPPSSMTSPSEDTSNSNNDDELHLSPESSLGRNNYSSRAGTIRTRFTPQLKVQTILNEQDELEQLTPQARDDQEAVPEERSISKRFNVLRFGTPDFLSPLRRGAARDYKKIE